MKQIKKFNDVPFLGLVCAECGVPGREIELPDGKTYFCCQKCGGTKPTTIDFFKEMKSKRRIRDDFKN